MVRPDRSTFRALARERSTVPVVREILADLDTPLGSFLKLDDGRTAFLFESMGPADQWGRYSIIGFGARASFLASQGRVEIERGEDRQVIELPVDRSVDPLHYLRELLAELAPAELPDLPKFAGGAVGFLSYDWVRYVERLPESGGDRLGVPDCFFTFPATVLVHDRQRQRFTLIAWSDVSQATSVDSAYDDALDRLEKLVQQLSSAVPDACQQPALSVPSSDARRPELAQHSNLTRERYGEMIDAAREYIKAGDIFQVVLSQRFVLPLRCDPIQIYRWLRVVNPSPYLFLLRCGGRTVIGSSPEILVRLEAGEIVLRPIAGTRPRGGAERDDQEIEQELLADPKEQAEHIMLVDLGRNDVGRVAEIGSVRVDELKVVERYAAVMHIVSNVRGRLRKDRDAIDLLRAAFPAGTLTGAPKVRAMQIIEELEPERRGLYGGAVGYIEHRGDMDMSIAIRTMLIQDGQIYLQAGGGIVADSDTEHEYQETIHKASALIRAIELANGGRLT
jgi:anthranilate synthase component 1